MKLPEVEENPGGGQDPHRVLVPLKEEEEIVFLLEEKHSRFIIIPLRIPLL